MPSATFEERRQRLARSVEATQPAPMAPRPQRPAIDRRSALERFDHGLALVAAGGQRPDRMAWLRLLARLGLPVAPYYYWPAHMLLAFFIAFPILFFAGMLSLVEWYEFTNKTVLNGRPIALLKWFDYGGIGALFVVLAPIAVWRHHRIARRADLPRWSEV